MVGVFFFSEKKKGEKNFLPENSSNLYNESGFTLSSVSWISTLFLMNKKEKGKMSEGGELP